MVVIKYIMSKIKMPLIGCGLIGCVIVYCLNGKGHPNLVKIGRRIREARKQKGYSQEAFAAEAQLSGLLMGTVLRKGNIASELN